MAWHGMEGGREGERGLAGQLHAADASCCCLGSRGGERVKCRSRIGCLWKSTAYLRGIWLTLHTMECAAFGTCTRGAVPKEWPVHAGCRGRGTRVPAACPDLRVGHRCQPRHCAGGWGRGDAGGEVRLQGQAAGGLAGEAGWVCRAPLGASTGPTCGRVVLCEGLLPQLAKASKMDGGWPEEMSTLEWCMPEDGQCSCIQPLYSSYQFPHDSNTRPAILHLSCRKLWPSSSQLSTTSRTP